MDILHNALTVKAVLQEKPGDKIDDPVKLFCEAGISKQFFLCYPLHGDPPKSAAPLIGRS
jgi:hypothetical protein